jgi:hypothetical protein
MTRTQPAGVERLAAAGNPASASGSIGTPFHPWDALDDVSLDPPVGPLVRALNATGWVRTVFSCGGHPEEADSVSCGRRQAHVDVVTREPARWREFVRVCQQLVPVRAYVRRPDGKGPRHVNPIVREGSLGLPPDWLRPHLLPVPQPQRTSWWQRHAPWASTGYQGWYYRRLAFEPFPYGAPPDACRPALDGALAAAVEALETLSATVAGGWAGH